MPTNTFTPGADIVRSELEANFSQALVRYSSKANYGVGGVVHSGSQAVQRVAADLTSQKFTWTQQGLGRIDVVGTGGLIVANHGSSFSMGTPVLTLTCLTAADAVGPTPPTWTWSGLSSSSSHILQPFNATRNVEPNNLIPGFRYQLELTNTGSPGTPDFLEFGIHLLRYPVRGGGI